MCNEYSTEVADYGIEVNEFKPHSRYYVYFRTKRYESYILR